MLQAHKGCLTPATRCLGAALLAVGLSACAVLKDPQDPNATVQTTDPWEGWNRKVFGFNESMDRHVLKPVATAYSEIVPGPVRQAASNFFGNVSDAWSAVNLCCKGGSSRAPSRPCDSR